jgi:hypothetical protein
MEIDMATAHTVINNFIRKGFNMLGNGCYAAVFDSNVDPNLVYKIGVRTSDPFLDYIQQSSLQANPHFPRIYDIACGDNWYLVKMERLEPIPSHKTFLSNEIRSLVEDEGDALVHLTPTPDLMAIAAQIRNLAEALDVKVDLHQGNIMMRGNTPVITDPLCDHDIESAWELENWFGKKSKGQRNASWSY